MKKLLILSFLFSSLPAFACMDLSGNWNSHLHAGRGKVVEIQQSSCSDLVLIDHRRAEGDIQYNIVMDGSTTNTVPRFFLNKKNQQMRSIGLTLNGLSYVGQLQSSGTYSNSYSARVNGSFTFLRRIGIDVEADVSIVSYNYAYAGSTGRMYVNAESIRVVGISGMPAALGRKFKEGANLVLKFVAALTDFDLDRR